MSGAVTPPKPAPAPASPVSPPVPTPAAVAGSPSHAPPPPKPAPPILPNLAAIAAVPPPTAVPASKESETVTVYCGLPQGLRLTLNDVPYVLITGTTNGIPARAFHRWLVEHADLQAVQAGLIVAFK